MKQRIIAVMLAVMLSSCGMNYAVTGNYNLNNTQVQLASNNFRVVDELSGSASVSYILLIGGLSEKQLYQNAYADMQRKADMKNSSRAIANVTSEEHIGGIMPFYFTRTVTVSANLIEFTK
jgi:hypothetical protein